MNHCLHIHSRLVKVTATNGTEMFACQCVTCGGKATAWIPRRYVTFPSAVAEESSKPPTIGERLAEERAKLQEEYGQRIAELYQRRRQLYDNYLKSPQWKSLREQVKRRCGGTCEDCGYRPMEEVHHLNYDSFGNEKLEDLLGLCSVCHLSRHPEHQERRTA